MIDLLLLGCGGGMPMPNRFLSSILLSYKGRKILIDCGEGTQVSMRMCNAGFKSLDIICITHIHGDHIVGLPGLLGTIGNSGRTEPLTIIGPEGITEVVKGLRTIANWLPYEVNVIEDPKDVIYMNNEYISKDIEISTIELDHSSPCIGYGFYLNRRPQFDTKRAIANNVPKAIWSKLQKGDNDIEFEGKIYTPQMVMGESRKGIKVCITQDTRPTENIAEFIKDSDYFICEGTYGDDNDLEKAIKNKHMTFREAATIAKNGNVKNLLLTHFSTAMDDPSIYQNNAKDIFENTIIGFDRYNTVINFPEDKAQSNK